ncbi:hypothetical protein [Tunturiibacter gelidoferens]|uniref:DUF91 domain-containing protein n=1 Tax=Tunturiibacter gelidiferens TaxID=3069689 RepID=A0A9X0QH21_9BACT|nr:hypothetical protein [Edaphobacter lichenicola]MBB5330075.1 hypothetical protein [Edaphobacter lichenicola]
MAQNLWDVLFEGSQLMPIHQERSWQPEADIYALNEQGYLVIFELKRAHADGGAVHQALRYCEKAGRFGYEKLEEMLRAYRKGRPANLQQEHQIGFDLEHPLDRSAFNRKQHLVIVGSAGDDELIRNVDYWKLKGLCLSFIPYRVYQIADEHYFEFFSLPYDQHSNPGLAKGVIFDTNLSYNEESIWYMCDGDRVAAFGSIQGIVHSFSKGDIVFLYHKGYGIIAAGQVKSEVREDAAADAMYRELKWLTPKPAKGKAFNFMTVSQIKQVTGRNFWWAKTMKAPFLNKEDTAHLLENLKEILA